MTKDVKNKTVFIGVSGGVDSSVSAALLKEQGYNVVGVFIKTWQPEWVECTWRDEKRDAMRVCAHLGIPFLFLDLEKEYKEGVADYMISEYKAGRTPNPDVMCNKEIKFGAFYKKARELGADFIATGHYAKTDNTRLFVGKDKNKDQSYFLWTIPQEVLQHVIFPVGHLEKKEVRILAEKYSLPTATKKDSQGICFIGPVDMKEFLSHYIDTQKGDVLDESGKVIGSHDGALLYTIGERHGLQISQHIPNQSPYFIIAKDIGKNTLIVSQDRLGVKDKETHTIVLDSCNWVTSLPETGKEYKIRMRYREDLSDAVIEKIGDTSAVIKPREKMLAPAGQSAVLYDGEVCLGGGIICE